MERLTRVYIAGKLNGKAVDYLKNVSDMMVVAEEVRQKGFSVFIPAIDLLMGIKHGYTNYHDYFDNGQPWLMAADAVFLVPGWEESKGTKDEIDTAIELGIPVFSNINELVMLNVGDTIQRQFVDETAEEKVEEPTTEVLELIAILKKGLRKAK